MKIINLGRIYSDFQQNNGKNAMHEFSLQKRLSALLSIIPCHHHKSVGTITNGKINKERPRFLKDFSDTPY